MNGCPERDLCVKIAALLGEVAELSPAKIVVEDLAEVEAEIQKASTGVVVVVACAGHERGEGDSRTGQFEVEILCSEKPKVNRAGGRKDFLSAAQAAQIVSETVDYVKLDGFGTVFYESRRRQDAGDRSETLVTLRVGQSETVCWGLADAMQAYGEITRKRTARGGAPIFEPGRNGRVKFTGVADPHVIVDLTANVVASAAEFPDLGDAFSCPVQGVETTFVCTLSELTEATDTGKTIHLAGRTVG